MQQVFKIALPGYNAFTDKNPDHFALYVDPDEKVDYVLIKEKSVETITIPAGNHLDIPHGLNYVPFCLVFVESSDMEWRKIFSRPIDGSGFYFEISNQFLTIYNDSAIEKRFSYHIFYDEIT